LLLISIGKTLFEAIVGRTIPDTATTTEKNDELLFPHGVPSHQNTASGLNHFSGLAFFAYGFSNRDPLWKKAHQETKRGLRTTSPKRRFICQHLWRSMSR